MMSIGRHARVLVAALAIGGAVLSLGTGQAEAKPKTTGDDGTRCVLKHIDGYLEFFMPGEIIYDPASGQYRKCGTDGEWHYTRTDDSGGRTNNGGGLGTYGAP
jgi:hypothetical protein